ncbi:MAG TPA: hypothetical protein VNT99_14575 [Methylomirabilota bacterium]|nr:hypothetical protein [Methylomirabilota bacterium]
MKLKLHECSGCESTRDGFTLVDALFAMGLAAIMFTGLYSGLAFGFRVIKMARENTRATQIMLEHMEICRLYTWTQLTNPAFVPTNNYFIVPYYSVGGTNTSLLYTGRITLATCPVTDGSGASTTYAADMRKLTIRLDWSPLGSSNRTRFMSTYVTRNGLQTYVW